MSWPRARSEISASARNTPTPSATIPPTSRHRPVPPGEVSLIFRFFPMRDRYPTSVYTVVQTFNDPAVSGTLPRDEDRGDRVSGARVRGMRRKREGPQEGAHAHHAARGRART